MNGQNVTKKVQALHKPVRSDLKMQPNITSITSKYACIHLFLARDTLLCYTVKVYFKALNQIFSGNREGGDYFERIFCRSC